MSWENDNVDMSQFDLGEFDAMFKSSQSNDQNIMVRRNFIEDRCYVLIHSYRIAGKAMVQER